jgi:hypothetical protein
MFVDGSGQISNRYREPSIDASYQASSWHVPLLKKSDILSQASYRYPISWEVFLDPSDSYFLFAEEQGYHK